MIKKFSIDDLQKCCDLFTNVFNGSPWNDNWTNETLLTGKITPAFEFYENFGCKHLEHLAFMYKRM